MRIPSSDEEGVTRSVTEGESNDEKISFSVKTNVLTLQLSEGGSG